MNILLPIETINRELDFKLVLAGYLAGKGHQIYLGQHDFIMKLVPSMKEGGLYIEKIFLMQMPIRRRREILFFKKNNFDVIYLNEEGAVFLKARKT